MEDCNLKFLTDSVKSFTQKFGPCPVGIALGPDEYKQLMAETDMTTRRISSMSRFSTLTGLPLFIKSTPGMEVLYSTKDFDRLEPSDG